MRNIIFCILVCLAVLEINAQYTEISTNRNSAATILGPAGDIVTKEQHDRLLQERKALIKHIRDSIDAIPWDTTRDNKYWQRAMMNSEWGFFTDKTVKLPPLLNLARKAYFFYTKAFNDYDTSYVAGIDKDWKLMIINNDWLDSYGGIIADKNMKVFMNSNVSSSMGIHFSYMGIGYTYMFDLDNVFGGDPTKHSKWDISFETSRFSFEAYKSRNDGKVNIQRFGDYRNGRDPGVSFMGLSRKSSGFDLYYFFNNRKYSQAAAYSYSKIQKRSAGSFILGFLLSNQDVKVDFSDLPDDMKVFLPGNEEDKYHYHYHYRVYSLMFCYAYNWVFRRNWLFNITVAPSLGLNHSYDDSVDGYRNMPSFDMRGRIGLVRNSHKFFYGLQLIFDAHLYHSKKHNFFNSVEDLTINAGFRF